MTSIQAPANRPIFDPAPVRGERQVLSPAVTGGTGLAELPAFNFANVVYLQGGRQMKSCVYVPGAAVTIRTIVWTVRVADNAGASSGPIFVLAVNGSTVYTSSRCTGLDGTDTVGIVVAAGQRLQALVTDHGEGAAQILTVMCRL